MAQIIRAMAGMLGFSALPEDQYINTFHFGTELVDDGDIATTFQGALDSFYDEFDQFLPAECTALDYRFYKLDDPEPREPIFATPGWAPTGASATLPYEVATCLSFYGDRNLPRKRGRVYVGPLLISTSTDTGDSAPVPSTAFRTALINAGLAMQAFLDGLGVGDEWIIYSPTNATGERVQNLWVDNEFDTQRRRGQKASSRLTAVVPGP